LIIHIIIGICEGIIDDIKAYFNSKEANEYERKLCEKYKIPYNSKAREEYYSTELAKHEVYHYLVEVQ